MLLHTGKTLSDGDIFPGLGLGFLAGRLSTVWEAQGGFMPVPYAALPL